MIANSRARAPYLIIPDEPNRGIDAGTFVETHDLNNRLSDEAEALIVISSYVLESRELSNCILVRPWGKVVEDCSALGATEEGIMYAAIN